MDVQHAVAYPDGHPLEYPHGFPADAPEASLSSTQKRRARMKRGAKRKREQLAGQLAAATAANPAAAAAAAAYAENHCMEAGSPDGGSTSHTHISVSNPFSPLTDAPKSKSKRQSVTNPSKLPKTTSKARGGDANGVSKTSNGHSKVAKGMSKQSNGWTKVTSKRTSNSRRVAFKDNNTSKTSNGRPKATKATSKRDLASKQTSPKGTKGYISQRVTGSKSWADAIKGLDSFDYAPPRDNTSRGGESEGLILCDGDHAKWEDESKQNDNDLESKTSDISPTLGSKLSNLEVEAMLAPIDDDETFSPRLLDETHVTETSLPAETPRSDSNELDAETNPDPFLIVQNTVSEKVRDFMKAACYMSTTIMPG